MSRSQKSDTLIIETLRKKGYKATTQRIAICRFALHSRDHPSAQRVYDEVRRVHPTVSLATVYKTLQILTEHDLLQELDLPESQARFDSYMQPHINLVCIQCGNIHDFDDNAAREMVERVATKAEFTRTGQRLDIYGVCKTCCNRNRSKNSAQARTQRGSDFYRPTPKERALTETSKRPHLHQLINLREDEFACKVAKTVEEAPQLIELGFYYVTDIEGCKLLKKRK